MKKNSFVEGTIIASAAILLTKLLGAIYVIPFYSIIGTQGGALYSYAYNVYSLFLDISVAGLPVAMSKIISEYNTLGLYEAKERAYKIGRNFILIISMLCFLILFFFSKEVAHLIIGDITGGNTIEDISFVMKCVSFCLLIIPFLSVSRGYLQGHKFIGATSSSQIIEQVVRIAVILLGSYIVVNILGKSVSIGVGVAVLGAFFGGLAAFIYLKYKINSNKKMFNPQKKGAKNDVSSLEIVKKIAIYALPLVITSVVTNVYSLTDLTLVIRGLAKLGYSAADAEVISSVISTWGVKICMIINSIAIGLSVSLMPNMVSSFVKNDTGETNRRFTQAINIIIVAALPLAVGLSVLSGPVYTLFYGHSLYGTIILKYLSFTAFFASLHIVMGMALQGLNKYKIIYINTILGFLTNAILDIPLMLLFNKLGIYPYYGAITATIIGYALSITLILISLKRSMKFSYKKTLSVIKRIVFPILAMASVLVILDLLIPDLSGRLIQIPIILLSALAGGALYIVMTYKNKTLEDVFGKEYINSILLKFKKVLKIKAKDEK